MTPRAQAFYDACCEAKEFDALSALALDLSINDIESGDGVFQSLALSIILATSVAQLDPYGWKTIQTQIDKEIASLREGVADHYKWRSAFVH